MKIHKRDKYGYTGLSYESYIVDIKDAELYEMIGFLISQDILYIINPPTMFIIANDIFAWGCADGETITWDEIPNLLFGKN